MYRTWPLLLAVLVWGVLARPDGWPHPPTGTGLTCQTPWKDCGSTGVKIVNVAVPGCCSAPCYVVVGDNATFSYTFTPNMGYNDLNQSACAIIETACVPFPQESFTDVCKSKECTVTPPCPFVTGTTYNVTVKFLIPTFVPHKFETTVEWRIYNTTASSSEKPIGCFEVPIKTE